jgi:5-dehydro-2-deoxygluconokinase
MIDLISVGRAGLDLYSLDYGVHFPEIRKFAKYVGGTAANVTVGASRLGLKAALLTRVSEDELGEFIVDFLEKEGVKTNWIVRDPLGKTGIVFAEVFPGKDSKFIFYREKAADLLLTADDVTQGMIEQTRSLVVTGTGLSERPSLDANLRAVALARQLGKTLVFNLDWRSTLWKTTEGDRVERYSKVIREADVLIGNEGEYLAGTGSRLLTDALAGIPDADKKVIVVTRGEKGSTVMTKDSQKLVPGFEVQLLKGLGGGDGFISGFMFGFLKGWPVESSVLFGNAVGAIVVTGHACSESMPNLAQAASFLKKKGMDFSESTGPFQKLNTRKSGINIHFTDDA